MSKMRLYARNLTANWIGYGANLLLALVTSWFVFHLLGDVRYGVWSLMMSLTGYLGMVDLGLRPALYRYFNWYLGRGEQEKVNEVLSTSLAFFVGACVVLLAAGAVLGAFFGQVFPKAPPEYLGEVGVAIVLMAVNVGLSAVAGVFGALFETHERYDLSNALDIAAAVVRSAGSILALYFGFGLVGLAVACVSVTGLAGAGGYVLARRVFRDLAVRRCHVKRATLAELLRFGIPCFFSGVGIRMISLTSPLLIAWLIDMSFVGYYAMAMALLDYGRALVQKATTIFTPGIQQSLAKEDLAGVRYMVPVVTRATMGISVLVFVGLMAFGEDFLTLFYGAAPAAVAGPVVVILAMAYLASSASVPCAVALIGAGRVRLLASVVLAEAAANLGLTIALVAVARKGLPGVALGTAIPMVLFSGLTIAVLGSRHIGMSLTAFARRTVGYWGPATVISGLMCVAIAKGLPFQSWGWFAIKVLLGCVVYVPVAWFVMLPQEQRKQLRGWAAAAWSFGTGARPPTEGR